MTGGDGGNHKLQQRPAAEIGETRMGEGSAVDSQSLVAGRGRAAHSLAAHGQLTGSPEVAVMRPWHHSGGVTMISFEQQQATNAVVESQVE